ncbi:hypothetical protein AGOR_G00097690 [Albula goreensis]|uniref:Uncharacterized protein n=1 Tax=Albula goreensis TaxID=1534307 RepID=A0A8T3DP37_9TELE|nr:hypothetical protein AGOR_G00097690 [Albula goreensis]
MSQEPAVKTSTYVKHASEGDVRCNFIESHSWHYMGQVPCIVWSTPRLAQQKDLLQHSKMFR